MPTAEPHPHPRLRLTEARISQGLSQQELANKIGTTDVNISRWERGMTRPGPYFRRKLCVLFGKSEQELNLEATEKWVDSRITELHATQFSPTEAAGGNGRERNADTEIAPPTKRYTPKPGAVYDPFIPRLAAIPLVGRERELAEIRAYLLRSGSAGSVALTALNGLPGVGKTALSIALAHDDVMREHFHDGVLWAGLGPQPDISSLLSHWCRVLELPEADMAVTNSNEARARALRGVIGTRHMLLVMDDAWDIKDALMFKVGGPNCAHLMTTRFPPLAAQFAPSGAVGIKELENEGSIELLRLLAPDVMQREAQKAQELITAVGGLPLALTVLGNYLRVQAATGSSRRMQAAMNRLSSAVERLTISEPQSPADPHSSLAATAQLSLERVFAVTDQRLTKKERKAFHALAVFPAKPNSFSEEAALFVADCTPDALDELSGTGLLEMSGDDRYTLHQTVADYASMQLGNDFSSHERLMKYVMQYVEKHRKDYELLERENANILAALEMAYEQRQPTAFIRITLAFTPYLLSRGLYTQARGHLQRAYEAAEAHKDSTSITNILLFQGRIARKQGEYAQAIGYLQKGLEIARQNDDQEARCSLLTDLGSLTWKQGKYNQTEEYLREGLIIAHTLEHDWRICAILGILGSLVFTQGNYIQAKDYLQEGLDIARQIGEREQTCDILITLGTIVAEQGNYTQAENYFQEGLMLARQIGHKEWISGLLNNLGDVAIGRDEYKQAEQYFQEGLELAYQSNHPELKSVLLVSLGLATRKQGHYVQAEGYLQEGLALARQIGAPQISANGLYEYGHIYLEQQLLDKAEQTFQEMLSITPEGSQDLIALAKYGLALTKKASGNTSEARKLGISSVMALEKMGHRNTSEVRTWLETLTSG